MLNYRWILRQKPDESIIKNLKESLGIPDGIAKILAARGLTNALDVKRFFDPSKSEIHDPFLLNGMDIAVERIIRAVNKGEAIWLHGDYDVDGTASTSMLLLFLREIGAKVDYYIPDRFREGYGLSVTSVNEAKRRNTKVLITVDVGITSIDALKYAKEQGMDAIVCDHHEPGEILPDVLTIIDPIKPNCNYPFKYLAACGVVFKLIQALSTTLNMPEKAFEYLDFVTLASAADMVPLIGENRVLVTMGLEQLRNNPRPGIKGLLDCINLDSHSINALNIVYSLAPLINAAGRLGDAKRSVEMMTQSNSVYAFRIAQMLEQENVRRRVLDEKTFEESIPIAMDILKDGNKRSLVLHKSDWHAGVIGIVASRLVDKFHLPTIMLTTIDGIAKGSARSILSFDIHAALKHCSDMLIEFGGHKHAAGLSIPEERVDEFRERFDEFAHNRLSTEMLVPEILIDTELKFNELSPNFITFLNRFAPYGFDNNKPLFYSKGVVSSNGVKIVGNNHLKFRAYQSHFEIDAIGYQLGNKIDMCTYGKPFSIVYNLEENVFNGRTSVQLRIKDIRPDDANE